MEKSGLSLVVAIALASGVSLQASAGGKKVAEQTVSFTDVSERIDFVHNGLPGGGDGLNGATWFDFDQDGLDDLFLTNGIGQANALYKNMGNGQFVDVSASAGVNDTIGHTGAVAGDIDNDGYPDLILTGDGASFFIQDAATPLIVYRNNGDGTFTDITAATGLVSSTTAVSASLGDINNDGHLDLFIAASGRSDILNGGANPLHDKSLLYVNNGHGNFTDITEASGVNADLGACVSGFSDYDNDGDVDLLVGNCIAFVDRLPASMQLFRNDGNLNFTDVTVASGLDKYRGFWMGLTFADYDNDGDVDFFCSNLGTVLRPETGHHLLGRNNGDGTFTNVAIEQGVGAAEWGWGAQFADYDNDGDADLFFAGALPPLGAIGVAPQPDPENPIPAELLPNLGNPGRLFFNDADGGNFVDGSDLLGINLVDRFTSGVAQSDFNRDGFPDIVVTSETLFDLESGEVSVVGSPALLENNGNKNNWIGLTLRGTDSNRDAVGAKAKVISIGKGGVSKQVKEIYAGTSLASTESKRLVFGLGVQKFAWVIVNWPSGLVEGFGVAKAGRDLTLVEGEGFKLK